jgi:hypothetical protein
MTLLERIGKALNDFTKGRASMHVPPLDTDVDIVLAECSVELRKLTLVDRKLETLDKLAGQFLQLSTERGGRVATAYAECADLLAKTVRNIRDET